MTNTPKALASAILEAGAYLLGSSWRVEGDIAARLAKDFYNGFVHGHPFGVRNARGTRQREKGK